MLIIIQQVRDSPVTIKRSQPTAMPFDEISKRNAHALLHRGRVVDVTRDVEQFGASVPFAPEASKPLRPATTDGWRDRHRFHVGDGRGTPENA